MWVKIDDRLHTHRKTRKVITSDADKRRDAAPMGLWILAASWAGQNGTGGWIPEHELDRWDDDWEPLAKRLTKAGFWWPEQHDGEPGYGFTDWEDYNPASGSSEAGVFGNHKRWHVDKGIVSPACPHCPQEPHDLDLPDPESGDDIGGRSGDDIGGRSGGESGGESQTIALPDPTRPDPTPNTSSANASSASADPGRFEEWWEAYGKKEGKKKAEQKWALALRKKGVTADLLIEATKRYIAERRASNKHPEFTKNPATWLNGEHWNDDVQLPMASGEHKWWA